MTVHPLRRSWTEALRPVLTVRWHPTRELGIVLVSWVLVVGFLAAATFIATPVNGFIYFLLYGIGAATLAGVALPLYWTVVVKRRPISDLGITRRHLKLSLALQLVLTLLINMQPMLALTMPPVGELIPLVGLALAIGAFEAIFWRGWVLQRLEAAFGTIPAVLAGSLLYAVYHVGYGMTASEMAFLFWIGVLFAVTFLLTRNVFILWPLFQPAGQLMTLVRESIGTAMPTIAILGFIDVLALIITLIYFAHRYAQRHATAEPGTPGHYAKA